MSFKTQVIWNMPMEELYSEQINDYKVQLHEAGLRVGNVDERIDIEGPGPGQKTVIHEWVNEATAQDWISFVSQFGPVSAIILG